MEKLLYDDAFEEITAQLVLIGLQKRRRTIKRKKNPDEVPGFNPKFRFIMELDGQGRME